WEPSLLNDLHSVALPKACFFTAAVPSGIAYPSMPGLRCFEAIKTAFRHRSVFLSSAIFRTAQPQRAGARKNRWTSQARWATIGQAHTATFLQLRSSNRRGDALV